jgi:hypothetical protein
MADTTRTRRAAERVDGVLMYKTPADNRGVIASQRKAAGQELPASFAQHRASPAQGWVLAVGLV